MNIARRRSHEHIMQVRGYLLLIASCASSCVLAQQNAAMPGTTETPEEVIVIGNRNLLSLRIEMLDAERNAYEVFNRFNDDRRFDISCGEQEPTGTRFRNQLCQPRFVRDAAAEHGRAYWENLRAYMDPTTADKDPPRAGQPYEVAVNRHRKAYQDKMKQVAEEHPEFLDALKAYAETRQQYEQATSSANE
jgi:hypothetical protein